MDDVRIYTGTLIADLILPAAQSLKDRRRAQRALVQRLRNREFALAQVGPADLVQRVFLAVTTVSGSQGMVEELLDGAERIMFASAFTVSDLRRVVTSETFFSGR